MPTRLLCAALAAFPLLGCMPLCTTTEPDAATVLLCSDDTDAQNAAYLPFGRTLLEDYRRFYSWKPLGRVGLGLGAAAIFANTSLDQDIRNWYQADVRSENSDDFAHIVKPVGNWKYVTPLYAVLTIVRRSRADINDAGPLEEWGERCLRAIAVGGPATLTLQWLTGAGRPVEGPSQWNPFNDDNGVSGHAFIGAVPFLAAARMAKSKGWKAFWICGSFLCGWSRINDDMHYLSQVGMGWWMAYLATGSVEEMESGVFLVPGGLGFSLTF